MKHRWLLLALLALLASPAWGDDAEIGGDTSGSFVTNKDGDFRFSLRPTIDIGRFSIMFDVTFKGTFQSDAPWMDFDLSNFKMPEHDVPHFHREAWEKYAAFVYSMHYGGRYDPFYFRYGKLENITLGDGALLSSYYDNSVGYLESRPGLQLRLGPFGRFGMELVMDDVFVPGLFGFRPYLRPFATEDPKRFKAFKDMEWGMSILFDPRSKKEVFELDQDGHCTAVDGSYRSLFETSFDVAQPFSLGGFGSVTLYTDYLAQGPHDSVFSGGRALRFGFGAHSPGGKLVGSASATIAAKGTYYADYFTSGYNDPDSNEYDAGDGTPQAMYEQWRDRDPLHHDELSIDNLGRLHPVEAGDIRLDASLGFNADQDQVYTLLRFRSTYDGKGWMDQRVNLVVRIDKLLWNFISLDLNYEKNYPSSGTEEEKFFSGLGTMENVYITMQAQIKYHGIKFVLGGKWQFDEQGDLGDSAFETSMQIVIF